ncbi:SRPBCC family protein [Nocardia arizonensis]|uniref:SRPBCC family protein n=1 Tax=Nocardia arizonensis TaxID=1141647 RepID=UPI0006CFED37|nr:SRPBCC family protein [Nocardia arizonensis]
MTTNTRKATVTLPTDEQILITRVFDASPSKVFRVWSTPELVRQWWSGGQGAVTSVEMDFRVGGRWRYVMVGPDGSDLAFHGSFREIVEGSRIVYNEQMEVPGGSTEDETGAPVNTVTFEPHASGTLLSLLVRTGSKELRDMIIDSGMEIGMQGQMDRIEEIAAAV